MNLGKARRILEIKKGTVMELLGICEAIWVYQGEKREPHAFLVSGKHSDG